MNDILYYDERINFHKSKKENLEIFYIYISYFLCKVYKILGFSKIRRTGG